MGRAIELGGFDVVINNAGVGTRSAPDPVRWGTAEVVAAIAEEVERTDADRPLRRPVGADVQQGVLGGLRVRQERCDEARQALSQAEATLRELGTPMQLAKVLVHRALLERATGADVAATLAEVRALVPRLHPRSGIGQALAEVEVATAPAEGRPARVTGACGNRGTGGRRRSPSLRRIRMPRRPPEARVDLVPLLGLVALLIPLLLLGTQLTPVTVASSRLPGL